MARKGSPLRLYPPGEHFGDSRLADGVPMRGVPPGRVLAPLGQGHVERVSPGQLEQVAPDEAAVLGRKLALLADDGAQTGRVEERSLAALSTGGGRGSYRSNGVRKTNETVTIAKHAEPIP